MNNLKRYSLLCGLLLAACLLLAGVIVHASKVTTTIIPNKPHTSSVSKKVHITIKSRSIREVKYSTTVKSKKLLGQVNKNTNNIPLFNQTNYTALYNLTISAYPSTIDNGQNTTVTVSWLGGIPNYTVRLYSGVSTSCASDSTLLVNVSGIPGNNATFVASPSTGTIYYCANVTDSTLANLSTSSPAEVIVNPAPTVTLSTSNPIVDAGQLETLNATVPAGTGTGPFLYTFYNVTAGTVISLCNSTSSTCSFSAGASGTFRYNVTVTDSATSFKSNSVAESILVYSAPITTLSESNAVLDAGQSETLNASTSGGSGSFVYTFYNVTSHSNVTGCTSIQTNTCTFATSPGSFTYNVISIDTGVTLPYVFTSGSSTIIVNNAISAVSITSSNSLLDGGQTDVLTALASGGTSPFVYTFYNVTSNSPITSCTSLASNICIIKAGPVTGNFIYNVSVMDSASTHSISNSVDLAIAVNSTPNVIIESTNPIADYGQTETLIAVVDTGVNSTTTIFTTTTSPSSTTTIPVNSTSSPTTTLSTTATSSTTVSSTTTLNTTTSTSIPTTTSLTTVPTTTSTSTSTTSLTTTSTSTTTSTTATTSGTTTIPTWQVPGGAVQVVNVSLDNLQSSAIAAGTQVKLSINLLNYSAYAAGGAYNFELFNGVTGEIVQQWQEGPISSGINNPNPASINTVTNDIIWFKTPSAIAPGNAVNVISIAFLPMNASAISANVGIAPELYCASGCAAGSYGQFDNGANVFSSYWAFGGLSGNSLPSGWSATSNGVIVDNPNSVGIDNFVSSIGYNSVYALAPYSSNTPGNVLEMLGQLTIFKAANEFASEFGQVRSNTPPSIGTNPGIDYSLGTDNSPGSIVLSGAAGIGPGVYSYQNVKNNVHLYGLASLSTSSFIAYIDYNAISTGTPDSVSPNKYIFLSSANAISTPTNVLWIRTRINPPGSTMPSVAFGQAQTAVGAGPLVRKHSVLSGTAAISSRVAEIKTISGTEFQLPSSGRFIYTFYNINNGTNVTGCTNTLNNTCSFVLSQQANSLNYNVTVRDTAPSSAYTFNSQIGSVKLSSQLVVSSLSASNSLLQIANEPEVLSASWSGGSGPYTVEFFNSTSGRALQTYGNVIGTSNTFTFLAHPPVLNAALRYTAYVTDSATTPVTANASAVTVSTHQGVRVVAVNIHNQLPVQVPSGFQFRLVVNSSKYKQYETGNLDNVVFVYQNGSAATSWLESNNTNTSTSTTYWVKLASSIATNTNASIYMVFTNISSNDFNNVTTGEAPELSAKYAQYDNGNYVFNFYDNFRGTTLSRKWLAGNVIVNNGLIIVGGKPSNNIETSQNFSQSNLTEFYGGFANQTSGGATGFNLYGFGQASGSVIKNTTENGINVVSAYSNSKTNAIMRTDYLGTITNNQTNVIISTGIKTIVYGVGYGGNVLSFFANYNAIKKYRLTAAQAPVMPLPIVFSTSISSSGRFTAYWVRDRAYVANGIMPSVQFGPITDISSISLPGLFILNQTAYQSQGIHIGQGAIFWGQNVTFADAGAAGGVAPYKYQWMEEAIGSNTFVNATNCQSPHSVTCKVIASPSNTPKGNYSFELVAKDSNLVPATLTTSPVRLLVENTTFSKIQHIIIIMQENHAFDDYFYTYPGVIGGYSSNTNFCEPGPHGECVKPWLDLNYTRADLDHYRLSSLAAWDNGKMDGFIGAEGGSNLTMSYQNNATIPFYWELAHHYVLDDMFFSSILSYSLPNHWLADAGATPNEIIANEPEPGTIDDLYLDQANRTATIADLLVNTSVTWKYYDFAIPPGTTWNGVNTNTGDSAGIGSFWDPYAAKPSTYTSAYAPHFVNRQTIYQSIQNGTLPDVSWVIPSNPLSEHPPDNISVGMYWTTNIIDSVENSSYWNNTVVIVTWDDYGGSFDTVAPPTLAGYQLGFRVPALVVSAYAKPGYIDNTTYSFESMLKLIEWRFQLRNLTSRDGAANNMLNSFNFNAPPSAPFIIPETQSQQQAATKDAVNKTADVD
jgi:phospholipase C